MEFNRAFKINLLCHEMNSDVNKTCNSFYSLPDWFIGMLRITGIQGGF